MSLLAIGPPGSAKVQLMAIRQVRSGLAARQRGGLHRKPEHCIDLLATQLSHAFDRIQLVLGQPGNQCRLEGIAGTDGVGDIDRAGRSRPLTMSSTEYGCALATPGQKHQLATVLQPAIDHSRRVLSGIQQAQIFVADFDQVGVLDQRGHP